MAIRVGRWDCPGCGRIGNLGPDPCCSGCGRLRGEDVRFYLPEDAEIVTGDEAINRAKSGSDWACDDCGSSNISGALKCRSCGNARTESDKYLSVTTYDTENVPRSGETVKDPAVSAVQSTNTPKKKKSHLFIWGAVLVIIAALFLFIPRNVEMTVSGHEWERAIAIENYRLMQHDDWSVPEGGMITRSYRDIHHYDKILDHYESRTRTVRVKVGEEKYVSGQRNLGNGNFEDVYSTRPVYEDKQEEYREPVYRQDPVYRIKYAYQIYEWVIDQTSVAKGQDQNSHWPKGAPNQKRWRDGAKNERYVLCVSEKNGKQYRIETSFERWDQLLVGTVVKAKKRFSQVTLTEQMLEKR